VAFLRTLAALTLREVFALAEGFTGEALSDRVLFFFDCFAIHHAPHDEDISTRANFNKGLFEQKPPSTLNVPV